MAEDKPKTCFVIAPIGKDGSEERKHSDDVLEYIITPIVEEFGYKPVRADDISQPGMIINQIVPHIVNDDLVIADLTYRNPNVFYEVAIRHAARKHIILIAPPGEEIPFDIAQHRAIFLDTTDLKSVELCKEQIKEQIKAIERGTIKVDSPVTNALIIESSLKSDDPQVKNNAQIMVRLDRIESMISAIISNPKSNIARPRINSFEVDEFIASRLGNPKYNIHQAKNIGDRTPMTRAIRYLTVDTADDKLLSPILEKISEALNGYSNITEEKANEIAKSIAGNLYEKYDIHVDIPTK